MTEESKEFLIKDNADESKPLLNLFRENERIDRAEASRRKERTLNEGLSRLVTEPFPDDDLMDIGDLANAEDGLLLYNEHRNS